MSSTPSPTTSRCSGVAVAGAMVSIVLGGGRMTSRGEADQTDELLFRIVFAALAALVLVVVLQSDTQNVVNADGQTASLWAVIGGSPNVWPGASLRTHRGRQLTDDGSAPETRCPTTSPRTGASGTPTHRSGSRPASVRGR